MLANEDVLQSGTYPLRLQVVGPGNFRALDRTIEVEVPACEIGKEPPLAYPIFNDVLEIEGPGGQYRFVAQFERGAAAFGGEVEFYVTDAHQMPVVCDEVVLWGEDNGLEKWFKLNQIATRRFNPAVTDQRELILVSRAPHASGGAEAFRDLATRVARGSSVVFLSSTVFAGDGELTRWAPLKNKGRIDQISRGAPQGLGPYMADDWCKNHPIFDGLQCGGLMDYTIYRDLIPDEVWFDQQVPAEAVSGSIFTSFGYSSGLLISVHEFGAGRIILNTLRIRETLGEVPVAERLLRNMLNYAAASWNGALAPLPDNFEAMLKSIDL